MNGTYVNSEKILEVTRIVNIACTSIAIFIGLCGNSLLLAIFKQKKFCTSSYHIYMMCLAINDSIFLFIHLIEVNIAKSYGINALVNFNFFSHFTSQGYSAFIQRYFHWLGCKWWKRKLVSWLDSCDNHYWQIRSRMSLG